MRKSVQVTIALIVSIVALSALVHRVHSSEFTVGNTAPSLSSIPSIETGSGEHVTISASAVDPNGDNFLMIICPDDDSITEASECADYAICTTGLAESGSAISCTFKSGQYSGKYALTLCDDNAAGPRCSLVYGSTYPLTVPADLDKIEHTAVLGASISPDQEPTSSSTTNAALTLIALVGIGMGSSIFLLKYLQNETPVQRNTALVSISLTLLSAGLIYMTIQSSGTEAPTQSTDETLVLGEQIEIQPSMHLAESPSHVNRPSIAGLYEIFIEPDEDSDVIYYATEGETFPVVQTTSDWSEIKLPNGSTGWIPVANAK